MDTEEGKKEVEGGMEGNKKISVCMVGGRRKEGRYGTWKG